MCETDVPVDPFRTRRDRMFTSTRQATYLSRIPTTRKAGEVYPWLVRVARTFSVRDAENRGFKRRNSRYAFAICAAVRIARTCGEHSALFRVTEGMECGSRIGKFAPPVRLSSASISGAPSERLCTTVFESPLARRPWAAGVREAT